jgi:hypothetical protein
MQERRRVRVTRVTPETQAEPESASPAPAPAEAVLALQRAHGNQAVGQMLARNGPTAPAKAPKDEFADQVKADNWTAAATAIKDLPDKEINDLIKGLTDDQLAKLGLAAWGLSLVPFMTGAYRLNRLVAFKRNPPAATTEGDQANVTKEGELKHSGKAGGGDVSVRTGAEYAGGTYKEGFSLGYKGKDAAKTRWLQFIWREIVVDHPTKKTYRVDDEIGTSGGRYRLTIDPKKPSYNTDTDPATGSPFYEAGGTNKRTADSTTIYDAPGAAQAFVDAAIDDGATKVTSRAHFTTYLVRDVDVLYKVEITVEWVFTSKTVPPRKNTVESGGAASNLDPDQRKRLVSQFPKVTYLP